MFGGELTDELGGAVDDDLVGRDTTDAVPRSIEKVAEPLDLRTADARPDAGLLPELRETRRADEPAPRDQQHVVGGLLHLCQRVAGDEHRASALCELAEV